MWVLSLIFVFAEINQGAQEVIYLFARDEPLIYLKFYCEGFYWNFFYFVFSLLRCIAQSDYDTVGLLL